MSEHGRRAIFRCTAGHEQDRPYRPRTAHLVTCCHGSRSGTMRRCSKTDHATCTHYIKGCGLPTTFVRELERTDAR